MKNSKQIMFVCTGNTCRSPMAEYLFKDLCEKKGINIKTISRGTFVYDQIKAQTDAISSMQRIQPNSSITNHKSKQLNLYDIIQSDLIITMGETHKESIISITLDTYLTTHSKTKSKDVLKKEINILYNHITNKVITLKEINNNPELNVSDPYYNIMTPIYKKYASIVSKIKDERIRKKLTKVDKLFDKIKLIPNVGPFKTYRQKVYDNCRDEILENLELLTQKIKPKKSGRVIAKK